MGKAIYCKDVGFDCDGMVRAESEKEVLQLAVEHAQSVHGVTELTSEMIENIQSVIRDEPSS